MTNQSTIDKLIEMRLTAMADAFRIQMDDPTMKEVPFEDRFGMLVDVEYSNRKNNRLKRLIRQAELEQPDASIAAIDYHSGRKLNKALINRLATCEYITEYRNIFITGATGSGKTYMACAFGMEACKHYYSVRYIRLPDLLLDLQTARDNGTFATVLKKYTKPIVLIIDEWLLLKLTEAEARNLFELIHKRRKKSSTIFCSQFRESEWYQQICDGESTLADAIMDRISYDSYKIDIESVDPSKDLSMREVYGLDPAMGFTLVLIYPRVAGINSKILIIIIGIRNFTTFFPNLTISQTPSFMTFSHFHLKKHYTVKMTNSQYVLDCWSF